MDSCYSGDHIAGDHIHTDMITSYTEEPQQKYRLGPVSNRLMSGLNMFYWNKPSPFASAAVRNVWSALAHQ